MRFACWLSEKPKPPPDAEPTRGFPARAYLSLSGPLRDYVRCIPYLLYKLTHPFGKEAFFKVPLSLILKQRGHWNCRPLILNGCAVPCARAEIFVGKWIWRLPQLTPAAGPASNGVKITLACHASLTFLPVRALPPARSLAGNQFGA